MAGGAGDDRLFVDNALDVVVEIAGQGSDSVFTTVNYTLAAGQSIETAGGQFGRDRPHADRQRTRQYRAGQCGRRHTQRRCRRRHHDGRGGADDMTGGTGNDKYYVDNAGDVLHEAAGSGTDTLDIVYSSVDYTLGAGLGIDVSTPTRGRPGLTLTGNELVNALFGNSGNDTLNGGDARTR